MVKDMQNLKDVNKAAAGLLESVAEELTRVETSVHGASELPFRHPARPQAQAALREAARFVHAASRSVREAAAFLELDSGDGEP